MSYLRNEKNILVDIASKYLKEDLSFTKKRVDILVNELISSEKIIEFAHTPCFFHVGILRCFLHFINLSKKLRASKIFFINDHLNVKALKETKGIPIVLPNNKSIVKYPSLKIPKKKQRFSLSKTLVPSQETIVSLTERLQELFPLAINKINILKGYMIECSNSSSNLASWYINLLFKLTKKNCLVIPTRLIFNSLDNSIHNPKINNYLLSYCKNCGARIDIPESKKNFCCNCNKLCDIEKIPNVFLRQNIANFFGFSHRVSGASKGYQKKSDEEKLFTNKVPIRVRVTGHTKAVNKLGETYKKMNMIQYYCTSNFNLIIPDETEVDWKLNI